MIGADLRVSKVIESSAAHVEAHVDERVRQGWCNRWCTGYCCVIVVYVGVVGMPGRTNFFLFSPLGSPILEPYLKGKKIIIRDLGQSFMMSMKSEKYNGNENHK